MAKRKTKVIIQVELELPIGSTSSHAVRFVQEGIQYYIGCVSTGHVMAGLDGMQVKCKLLKKEITYGS